MKATIALLFMTISSVSTMVASSHACTEADSTQAIFDCYNSRKIESDKLLNAQYTALKLRIKKTYTADPVLGEKYFQLVKNSQFSWIAFRDSNCLVKAFEIDVGTQAYEIEQNKCIAEMSQARSAELAQIAQ